MALKKETPPVLKAEEQDDDARLADGEELDDLDEGVQDAVTTDANEMPDMIMEGVGDPDVNILMQDEDLLEEDVIDLKSPEVAAEKHGLLRDMSVALPE